ncbi:MAG: ABC transporter substrate-binding protein [Chloroflexi bacterium]|nr:ABC transporter substrate-binding protein [Chloroflexota bacterium]
MHPYIPELKELFRQGKVTRREFVQNATMLGLSLSAATAFLAACAQQQAAAPQPTLSAPAQPTRPPAPAPTTAPAAAAPTAAATAAPARPAAAATAAPTAAQAAAAGIKRGGVLRVSTRIQRLPDPPKFSWGSTIAKEVSEYLTEVDEKGIPYPHLLEKFEATEDAKTWTLHVRKGVEFFNLPKKRELDAEDVVWNIKRWVTKETGGSMAGLMDYLKPTGVEKVDNYTVKLHLDRGEIGVPYHFYHYPALIMPREFEGGVEWTAKPWGTGPMELVEFTVGERARVKRREGYWKNGKDGKSLPYVDEIIYVDYGEEAATTVAAMAGGQVDIASVQPATVPAYERIGAIIHKTPSSQTVIFRMRSDKKPWDDERVRNALKLSVDTADMIKRAYPLGTPGFDTHSNESQPDHVSPGERKRDIALAKKLLTEAGYPDGLEVTLTYKVSPEYEGLGATVLKQHAEAAGIRIKLGPVPSAQYWDKWTEYDFGFTGWAHRPLATMSLSLAYSCDGYWNESHWCDKEWTKQLAEAAGTVDLEKRRKLMGPLLKSLADHGPIINRWHLPTLGAVSKRTKDYVGNSYGGALYRNIWLEG